MFHLGFCYLVLPVSFNQAQHVVTAYGVHGVQLDGVKSASFYQPVKQANPVTAIRGKVAKVVVAID